MAGCIPFRLTLLLVSGFWLAGCIPYTAHRDDPYFTGYHRADPSQGVTVAITDRKAPLQSEPSVESQTVPTPPEAAAAPEDRDYTYQDWYRNRYRNEDAFQLNLSYHLYGPYYYRDFRSRYWLQYQRRWHRLPWHGNGRMFDDLWWDYPYRGYGLDRWNDPWYGYYDPWYGYYDPWYYDPYYGHSYSYYGGYGWPSWHSMQGTPTTGKARVKTTQRRSRNRRDLPTGLAHESDSSLPDVPLRARSPLTGLGPESGVEKGKAVASQSGRSKSRGTPTGSARRSRWQDSGSSSASSGRQARPSSRGSSVTRSFSSSNSSGKSRKSTNTARSRRRKP